MSRGRPAPALSRLGRASQTRPASLFTHPWVFLVLRTGIASIVASVLATNLLRRAMAAPSEEAGGEGRSGEANVVVVVPIIAGNHMHNFYGRGRKRRLW